MKHKIDIIGKEVMKIIDILIHHYHNFTKQFKIFIFSLILLMELFL